MSAQNSTHICFPLFLSNRHQSSHCLTNKNKDDCELLLQRSDISHHHWYIKWFSSTSLLYTIYQNGTHRNILLYKIKWLWIYKSILSLLNISLLHGKIINWPRPKWGFPPYQITRVGIYLVFRSCWSRKWESLAVKPLNIVQLHDLIIVLCPPSLSLPFVKYIATIHQM